MRKTWLMSGVSLVVGAALGYFLRGTKENRVPPATAVAAAAEVIAVKPEAVPAPPSSREAVPRDAVMVASTPQSRLELLRLLDEWQKQRLLSFRVEVFDQQKHLSPALKQLLNISEAEAAVLNGATDGVLRRIGEIEARHATARRDPETGAIVMTVPSFPSEGGRLYDELVAKFAAVLGPERNEVFQQIGAPSFEYSFGGFGVQQRTLTIQTEPAAGGTPQIIRLRDQRVHPNTLLEHPGVVSSHSDSAFLSRDELVRHLGPIGAKVPAME